MLTEIRQHLLAYSALCLILGLFVLLFLWFWPQTWILRGFIIGVGVAYVIWGVLTHVKTRRITSRVFFEYAALALIACLLLWMLTL